MNILQNYPLKNLNSFGFEAKAKYFFNAHSISDLKELIGTKWFSDEKNLILGAGSNILLSKDFDGLVIHINIPGIEIKKETETKISLKVGAGEHWDTFVQHTVIRNFGGLENLSSIPGTVGASPIQNISAYGQEVKDTVTKVYALSCDSLEIEEFSNKQCKFGYRNSIFRSKLKGKYIITHVSFELVKQPVSFLTDYTGVKEELKGKEINIKNVRNAIVAIRKRKLPNPKVIGNAGSFFKNVELSKQTFSDLQNDFPELKDSPIYPSAVGIKIPAAWLIDKCGFRGKGKAKRKCVGVHEKHALVLVNYGCGTGQQILELAEKIQKTVLERFGIILSLEVNIV